MLLRLNNNQLKQLAEFSSNLSLVFIGGAVVPLFSGKEDVKIINEIVGSVLAAICIVTSLIILRRKRR